MILYSISHVLGQFPEHELRAFGIFHHDKIVFILFDQDVFEPLCNFQLIALSKSGIGDDIRKLDRPEPNRNG